MIFTLHVVSSIDFELTLITYLHDVMPISLACPKSRLLTQHNQEVTQ